MDSLFISTLTSIRTQISFISLITLCVVGFIGNSVTVYIFTKKNFRAYSMNVFLACLSVSSTLRLGAVWFHRYPEIAASDSILCKVLTIVVGFPWYFNITKKLTFQLGCLFGLFALIFAANIHTLVVYNVIEKVNASDSCGIAPEFGSYLETKTISLFNLILMPNILPFVLMSLFTVLFIVHLLRSKAKLKKSNQREVKFAKTIVGLNIYFLICNLPFGIAHFFIIYFKFNQVDASVVAFITTILSLLSQAHNACQFMVHLICNKLYRQEFQALLCCLACSYKDRKVEYSAKSTGPKNPPNLTKNTNI